MAQEKPGDGEVLIPAEKVVVQSTLRGNVLLGLVGITITVCLFIVVWDSELNEFAKGLITLILGKYLGMFESAFFFEFGQTRTSLAKDNTIKDLTKAATVTADTAKVSADTAKATADVLGVVAASSPAPPQPNLQNLATPAPSGSPTEAGTVNLQADIVNVNKDPTNDHNSPKG